MRLVKALVKDGFTIVSGLATGIETTAHETAIADGGRTIAVIGTPLSSVYHGKTRRCSGALPMNFCSSRRCP